MTIHILKTISIIAILPCFIPLLSACDSIRGSSTSETGTRSNPTPSMLAFEFVSGSGIKNIELIGCDGNVLFDPAHQISTSVSDFSEGTEFETDMTTAFFFDDFSFDCFKIVKVSSDKKQTEIDVNALEWHVSGPGKTLDFEYQKSYRTVLDSRTNPLFK